MRLFSQCRYHFLFIDFIFDYIIIEELRAGSKNKKIYKNISPLNESRNRVEDTFYLEPWNTSSSLNNSKVNENNKRLSYT